MRRLREQVDKVARIRSIAHTITPLRSASPAIASVTSVPGRETALADDLVTDLRLRIAALERENAELAARANSAVANAQDRVYWLDRWGIDLNALMRRPGASEFRAAVRVLRSIVRLAKKIALRLAR